MAKKKAAEALAAKQLLAQLKKGEAPDAVYYLHGDDPYLLQEVVEQIKGLVQPSFRDFNLHQLSGGSCEGSQIVAMANQLPVMDQRTVVVVREADQLGKEHWEALQAYLQDPSETTCLLFVDANRKPQIDSRTKTGKLLQGYLVAALQPFESQIPAWVVERAQQHHLKINRMQAETLVQLLGAEMSALDHALARLSLFLGGKGIVSDQVIEEVIVSQRAYNIFDLSGAVAQGDLRRALQLTRSLVEQGEHPLKLLALLTNAFRELLRARVDLDAGQPPSSLDKYIHPSLRYKRDEHLRNFRLQVERFSRQALIDALSQIHQTDIAFKSSSGLPDLLLMEQLILHLASRQR
jgi:DNA polymerase-3 subunit delta